jgi:hypothetical protein
MDHFGGLDVSVKETSICIEDDTGRIVKEVKVASEPGRQADVFLDLRELQPRIARDPVERPLATADRAPKPMMPTKRRTSSL